MCGWCEVTHPNPSQNRSEKKKNPERIKKKIQLTIDFVYNDSKVQAFRSPLRALFGAITNKIRCFHLINHYFHIKMGAIPIKIILRSCVYFGIALSISLFIAGFLSGDLSRSSSNAAF